MSLRNLPERYLFDLLPEGIIRLDEAGLVEAVLGGYQDRIADLRAFAGHFPDFVNPDAELPTITANVVFAILTTEAGRVVPVSLDFQDGMPSLDDEAALTAWAASQLNVPVDQLGAVFAGTDTLRSVTIDTLSLLAANIGATLFAGVDDEETPEQQRARAQNIVRSWFPALKVKGTAQSFSVLGRLLGFADVAVVPLWKRLSPREPADYGAVANDPDFSERADQQIAGQLPSPTYTPQAFLDGPYYSWTSPRLTPISTSENYYLPAVNNRNPFIRLVQTAGTIENPPVGDFILGGGAPNLRASVVLSAGTDVSNLTAEAIAEGDDFNGLVIHVADSFGTEREMSIVDQLSLLKYRASWMDVKIGLTNIGTEPVQPNADLEADPDLVGTLAEAPFRPWSAGARSFAVMTWPSPVVADLGIITERVQAAGTEVEDDPEVYRAALRTAESLETVRPATRQIRSLGVGPFLVDDVIYAAYPKEALLFEGAGPGNFAGTLQDWQRPEGAFTTAIAALHGTNEVDAVTELDDDVVSFAGAGFNGSFDQDTAIFDLTVAAGTFATDGTLSAILTPVSTEIIREEPTPAAKESGSIGYQNRPEDYGDFSSGTLEVYDEYPWKRQLLWVGGEDVGRDYYLPYIEDIAVHPTQRPAWAPGADGNPRSVYVVAAPPTPTPYRFKVEEPESISQTTGLPLADPPHVPLLAQMDGTLYPVLWSEPAMVSPSIWNALQPDLSLWLPLNEHPLARRQVDGHGFSSLQVTNLDDTDRKWDDDFGWYLELSPTTYIRAVRREEARSIYTLALYLKVPAGASNQRFLQFDDGLATLLINGATVVLEHLKDDGSVATLTKAITNAAWQFIVVRRNGSLLELGVGDTSTPVAYVSTTDEDLQEPTTASLTLLGGTVAISLHDLAIWNAAKIDDVLSNLRAPSFQRVQTPFPTPWVDTAAGDGHFGFTLLPSGFAYPDAIELEQTQWSPGYAVRYDGEGRFQGDPRFQQVGLGDGYRPQSSYTLGLQEAGVEGDGAVLVTGSNPPLGWNEEFYPVVGQFLRVSPPYGPTGGVVSFGTESPVPSTMPSLQDTTNPAVERTYIVGDTGTVYEVWVDDLGAGAELRAKPIVRHRPLLEQQEGVSPPNRDEPTDFHSVLSRPGTILSVVDDGTTATPYAKSDGSVTRQTPPLYLYRNSIVVIDEPDAYDRWANPNLEGQAIETASRDTAGELLFSNTEPLSVGNYELILDVGNLGTVDDDFDGFAVAVSLTTGFSGSVVQTTANLLPNGTGLNPRGETKVLIRLATAITGSSVLRIDWSNPRTVPSKGQKRYLAVYAYTLRRLTTALYEVDLDPSLTLNQVDLGGTLPPGGLYGVVNSYGTISELHHEADTYGDEESPWPLASVLTTSTVRRREVLRAFEPWQIVDPTPPSAPSLGTISTDEALYQFGDTARLGIQVLGGLNLRYVWQFYDGQSIVTDGTEVDKVISAGTAPFDVEVTAVNDIGGTDLVEGTLPVNEPPTVIIDAQPTFDVFPYTGTLFGTVTDPEGGTTDSAFYDEAGVLLSSGTDLILIIDEAQEVLMRSNDTDGGQTDRAIFFSGLPNKSPEVSPIMGPVEARLSTSGSLQFAVIARDFENRGLSFLWTFWEGTEDEGLTTAIGYSNAYYNTAFVPLAGSTQGIKIVTLQVTDGDANVTTVTLNVQLLPNRDPVIVSVVTPVNSILAGTNVPYTVTATDADGDSLSYTFTFTNPGSTTIAGAAVLFPTTLAQVGQFITGTVEVDDGNGGVVSTSVPQVYIAASQIAPITPTYASGYYSTGLVQQLTAEAGTTIRYTLDGTDIFSQTDGLSYVGPFTLFPAGGVGVITLKARAFSTAGNVAASEQFEAVYTFFNPT